MLQAGGLCCGLSEPTSGSLCAGKKSSVMVCGNANICQWNITIDYNYARFKSLHYADSDRDQQQSRNDLKLATL